VPSIKRVIITATVGVVLGEREDEIYNGTSLYPSLLPIPKLLTRPEQTIQPIPEGPYTEAFTAYSASKRLAYRATTDFIATHKPSFIIVNLMPTFIVGSWELATSAAALPNGSNGIALSSVLGASMPAPMPGITIHVQDLARVHVEAMTNEKIQTHEDIILNADDTEGCVWTDTIKIAEKHFPRAVKKGILPLGGNTPTARRRVDGSKAERVFGIKMMGFEEQIVSVVGQFVELAEKAQGQKA